MKITDNTRRRENHALLLSQVLLFTMAGATHAATQAEIQAKIDYDEILKEKYIEWRLGKDADSRGLQLHLRLRMHFFTLETQADLTVPLSR